MNKVRTALFSMIIVCGLGVVVSPQVQLDVCGCKNNPASLGNFDSKDTSTYPPGTTSNAVNTMEIPLPADGVLVFNSINLVERPPYIGYGLTVRFIRNAGEYAGHAAGQRRREHRTVGESDRGWRRRNHGVDQRARQGRSRRARRIPGR